MSLGSIHEQYAAARAGASSLGLGAAMRASF